MSKRALVLLLVGCLFTAALWAADDPFVGEWKLNPSKSTLIDEMKVESAGGRMKVEGRADGRWTATRKPSESRR